MDKSKPIDLSALEKPALEKRVLEKPDKPALEQKYPSPILHDMRDRFDKRGLTQDRQLYIEGMESVFKIADNIEDYYPIDIEDGPLLSRLKLELAQRTITSFKEYLESYIADVINAMREDQYAEEHINTL